MSEMVGGIMAKVTVWYDGACPLCIREIALMRWLDAQHSIEFLDIAPADAVCPLDRHSSRRTSDSDASGMNVCSSSKLATKSLKASKYSWDPRSSFR
jgi:predicted DCC family thiol-disulfide oxidoreductase YuxK